jgi:4'-phosphopantetheinyl transferase
VTLTLDARRIHLWCTFASKVTDDGLLEEYCSMLSAAELEQWRRFHFSRDRHRYLITRALVRTVLSRYVHVAAKDWVFTTNSYGRPFIANDDDGAREISFNVTHTHDLVVLAVTRDRALGVDAEDAARHVPLDIADHFFASEEVEALFALPADGRQRAFFEYWTLKEAYIKARSMGLSIPLDQFSFRFTRDEEIELTIHPGQRDRPSRWRFWQLSFLPHYLVAVCAERDIGAAEGLIVNEVIPLRSECQLGYTLLRTSRVAGP